MRSGNLCVTRGYDTTTLITLRASIAACALIATIVPGYGQADTEAALKQRLKVLEVRIDYLEKKLLRVEEVKAKEAAEKAKEAAEKTKTTGNRAGNGIGPPASRQDTTGTQSSAPAAEPTEGATSGGQAKNGAPKSAATRAEEARESTAPQETFIFRDQSPTLKKGGFEIGQDATYLRGSQFLQTDRAVVGSTALRYGIMEGLEASLAIPYYYSLRDTQIAPNQLFRETLQGIGSANAGLTYSLLNQTEDHPGVAGSLTVIYPGSVSPYNFDPKVYQAGTSPVNILQSVLGSGHWGIGFNLTAFKIVDPLVIFGGGGVQYYFPRSFSGYEVEPAARFLFNMGVSLAMSEKTTIGVDFRSSFAPDFSVNGYRIHQSFLEQYIGRFVVTQRIGENLWLEPTVVIGLTKDSPDLAVSAAVRKRF
jgi:hypothetical protein